MSEAIILYRGRGQYSDNNPIIVSQSGTFKAPKTGEYKIYAVGGGAGGGGGCRNHANSQQQFYGGGGNSGISNPVRWYLNKNEELSITIGSGGKAGTNNTTVVGQNSIGTNGGTGGTTVVGPWISAVGGIYGVRSWSHYGSKPIKWNNVFHWDFYNNIRQDDTLDYLWSNQLRLIHSSIMKNSHMRATNHLWLNEYNIANGKWHNINRSNDVYTMMNFLGSYAYQLTESEQRNVRFVFNSNGIYNTVGGSDPIPSHIEARYNVLNFINNVIRLGRGVWCNGNIQNSEYKNWVNYYNNGWFMVYQLCLGYWPNSTAHYVDKYSSISYWTNDPIEYGANESIYDNCYTSIQQGKWWYANFSTRNNAVANTQIDSGYHRTYYGDGGASGRPGNSGFVLIIPPEN